MATSTIALGSWRWAASIAAGIPEASLTFVVPLLEPLRAGLTKSGKPREVIFAISIP